MNLLRLLLLLSLALVLTPACSPQPGKKATPGAKANVLATVGGTEITTEDFLAYAQERRVSDTPEARSALLEEMITEVSLVRKAQAAGLDQTPAYRRAGRQFLTSRLDEQELQPLLAQADTVPDAELEAACKEAVARLTQPATRRVAWIRITAGENERSAALENLKAAADQYRALPADSGRIGFGAVAARFSDDTDTRYQGGDLGWLTPPQFAGRVPPALAQAISILRPGQLGEPVILPDGVCLAMVTGERPAAPPAPEAIRARVKQELITKRRAETTAAFRRAARQSTAVEIHRALLGSIPLPSSNPTTPLLPAPTP